jgi:hypothetical protein
MCGRSFGAPNFAAVSQAMGDPENEQQENDEGNSEDGEGEGREGEQEGVVLPGMTARLAQMAGDEAVVAAISLPCDVEDVAEERNRADQDVQCQIKHHADEGDPGNAAHPGRENENERRDAADDVAKARDEANQAVEAKTDASAGDPEAVVEEMREEVEVLVGEEVFGPLAEGEARRKNLGFWGFLHEVFVVQCPFGRSGKGDSWAAFSACRCDEMRPRPMLQSGLAWRL